MSELHGDRRIDRMDDRQSDQEGRVSALERLVNIANDRLTEERKANADERRANDARLAEERKANAEERKANEARLADERRANDARLAEERKANADERKANEVRLAEERKANEVRLAEERKANADERRANDARLADERNNYRSERKWMIGTYVGLVIAVVGILGIVLSFVSPVLK